MSIDTTTFRQVMGQFATGVTIITSLQDRRPTGSTANSFTSISLDPPLIMVSIGNNNATLQAIATSGLFAVNILSDEHLELARCFARQGPEKYERFCSTPYHTEGTGAPIIDAALAWIDCRVFAMHPAGDHTMIVGEVQSLHTTSGSPLLFWNGKYYTLSSDRQL